MMFNRRREALTTWPPLPLGCTGEGERGQSDSAMTTPGGDGDYRYQISGTCRWGPGLVGVSDLDSPPSARESPAGKLPLCVLINVGGSILGPVLFAVYAIYFPTHIRDQRLHDHGLPVTARVVDRYGSGRELHGAEDSLVQFPLRSGASAEARLDLDPGALVGDPVAIVYDANNPSVAALPFQAEGADLASFIFRTILVVTGAAVLFSFVARWSGSRGP